MTMMMDDVAMQHGRLEREAAKFRRWKINTTMDLKTGAEKLQDSQMSVEVFRKEVERLQGNNRNFEAKLKAAYAEKNDLVLEMESIGRKLQVYEAEFNRATETVEALKEAREDSDSIQAEIRDDVSQLRSQYVALQEKRTSESRELATELSAERARLSSTVAAAAAEKQRLTARIEQLNHVIQVAEGKRDGLERELAAAQAEVRRVQKENEAFRVGIEDDKIEIQRLGGLYADSTATMEKRIAETKGQLGKEEDLHEASRDQLKKEQESHISAEAKIADLNQHVEDLKKFLSDCKADYDSRMEETNAEKQQLHDAYAKCQASGKKTVDEIREQLEKEQLMHESSRDELKKEKEGLAFAQAKIMEMEGLLKSQENMISEGKAETEVWKKKCTNIQEHLDGLADEMLSLKMSLQVKVTENQELNSESSASISGLQQENHVLKEKCVDMENNLNSLTIDYENNQMQLELQKNNNVELLTSIDKNELEIVSYSAMLTTGKKEEATLHRKLCELEEAKARQESESGLLERNLNEVESKFDEISGQNTLLREEIEELQTKNEAETVKVSGSLKKSTEELKAKKAELVKLNKALEKARKENDTKEAAIAKGKESLQKSVEECKSANELHKKSLEDCELKEKSIEHLKEGLLAKESGFLQREDHLRAQMLHANEEQLRSYKTHLDQIESEKLLFEGQTKEKLYNIEKQLVQEEKQLVQERRKVQELEEKLKLSEDSAETSAQRDASEKFDIVMKELEDEKEKVSNEEKARQKLEDENARLKKDLSIFKKPRTPLPKPTLETLPVEKRQNAAAPKPIGRFSPSLFGSDDSDNCSSPPSAIGAKTAVASEKKSGSLGAGSSRRQKRILIGTDDSSKENRSSKPHGTDPKRPRKFFKFSTPSGQRLFDMDDE